MARKRREELTAQQYECIRLMVEGKKSNKQIYDELGIAKNTFYRWLADERFKTAKDKAIRDHLGNSVAEATNVIIDLMRQSDDKRTQLKAAQMIMELNGLKVEKAVDVKTTGDFIISLINADESTDEEDD